MATGRVEVFSSARNCDMIDDKNVEKEEGGFLLVESRSETSRLDFMHDDTRKNG